MADGLFAANRERLARRRRCGRPPRQTRDTSQVPLDRQTQHTHPQRRSRDTTTQNPERPAAPTATEPRHIVSVTTTTSKRRRQQPTAVNTASIHETRRCPTQDNSSRICGTVNSQNTCWYPSVRLRPFGDFCLGQYWLGAGISGVFLLRCAVAVV